MVTIGLTVTKGAVKSTPFFMMRTSPSFRVTKSRFEPSGDQANPVALPRFVGSFTKTDSEKFESSAVPACESSR